uniref:Uncharacterized protein n=1 Tax=viral metagenome TaxID=1070528 RepID=A0A6C0ET14_9ZZZZ
MRQKYLNNVKVILILLVGVTVLFAILGTLKLLPEREGMHDDAPACYSNLHDTSDNCSDIDYEADHNYSEYESDDLCNNDNYILKTKMVPPKSTPCPTKISADATNYLDSVTSSTSSSSVNDSYTLSNTSTEPSSNTNTPTEKTSKTSNTANSSNTSTSISKSTTTPEPTASNSSNASISASPLDSGYMLTDTKKEKKDSCPPCPACERCPEPAFDCKKVPNYRSPSIGSYLPMPILTDFSKF